MVESSRQAGADEIEITEAMIAAGVAVLWEREGDCLKETLAEAVFRAMLAACPTRFLQEGSIEAKAEFPGSEDHRPLV